MDNAQQICGIKYDQERLAAEIALHAQFASVSVETMMRAGQTAADRQAPHVTREACRNARSQAHRLDML